MIAVRESIRNRRPLRRRWLEATVVAALVAAFGLVGGAVGVGLGILVAGVWYVSDVPYAVAAATICLVVLVPEFEPAVVGVAVLLGILVVSTTVTWGGSARVIAMSVFASLAFGGLASVGATRGRVWLTAAAILGGIGLVGYVLHGVACLEVGDGIEQSSETEDASATR
ncbi:hypothetical protein [Natronococcus sp. A-GB7]|uniref:hypothetical protein n=1 Tax=Natronococcus sp. A-GB7 TaxID=3037649 RepID=UPI00241D643E|nr:hypothetical protein [Natronococcus sp. A-GB7]MDG5819746.1 hypothetical protein [Natronococcus sp. A-GB7]